MVRTLTLHTMIWVWKFEIQKDVDMWFGRELVLLTWCSSVVNKDHFQELVNGNAILELPLPNRPKCSISNKTRSYFGYKYEAKNLEISRMKSK